jgi:TPR repeat protein
MIDYENYDFSNDSGDAAFQELLAKALSGSITAQRELCGAYLSGDGVKKDTDKADYWAGKMREHGIGLSEDERQNIPIT